MRLFKSEKREFPDTWRQEMREHELRVRIALLTVFLAAGDEMEVVVRRADKALSDAKTRGKGRISKSRHRGRAA